MKNIPRRIKILGAIMVVIVIALVVYFISRPKKEVGPPSPTAISISSSNPPNGASGVSVFDPIIITFNQSVDPGTIFVTSDPPENWTISQAAPDSINVNHKLYLRVATDYTLTVSQHGNAIGKIIFETAHEQNDPRFLQSLQAERDKNYPLLSLTPYVTTDYRVVYVAPLTLEIDLTSNIDPQTAITQVKSWVQSRGIDPSTHKYNVVAPTPAP